MNTGENEQGLRKIMDITQMISLGFLGLHFYFFCYHFFESHKLTSLISDRLLENISRTGLFETFERSKFLALLFLIFSSFGFRGKKQQDISSHHILSYLSSGLLIYFSSRYLLQLTRFGNHYATVYILVCSFGYLLILKGAMLLSRIVKLSMKKDVFNSLNETFPQEERFMNNEYSINLPASYNLHGKIRNSWINIINPFRGTLIMGSPGSGKSFFLIQHIIRQHISKGFSMFIYDFKFDDLTRIAYQYCTKCNKDLLKSHKFYIIDFDHMDLSHRCNPLDPTTLEDISDAAESSRTIMLGLNQEWIKKQGDFFVESPINFVTALIWFLAKYKNGVFCTLPHVIELAQVEYRKLFSVLQTQPEIEVLINPFISAFEHEAMEQLEGQIASAKISLARLVSPHIYYILSGNDFTLDINNPKTPKIVCMGNNPQKSSTYGAVISLYTTALTRLINKKGGIKSSLIFDEFPTIYFNGIDKLIATARSNHIATFLAVQDYSQLKFHYGKDQAEVILNLTGNIICGQVFGESARQLSERLGKIIQERESITINSHDTSVSKSFQMDAAIPPSKIASLSSGEFTGIISDNPDTRMNLKKFYSCINHQHKYLSSEIFENVSLPTVRSVSNQDISRCFFQVKQDIKFIVESELERILNTPELHASLIYEPK